MKVAATGGVLLVIGVASLSDTIFKGPIGELLSFVFYLGLRIVPGTEAFTAGGRFDLPIGKDTIGHFVAWAMVGMVAAGVFKRWQWRVVTFVSLFVLSALIEVGQQYLSWSRSAEFSDLAANGFGLVAGFGAFIIGELVLRLVLPSFDSKRESWFRQLRSL